MMVYSGWADINLLIENKGQANQTFRLGNNYRYNYYNNGFEIDFQKLLPNKVLFKLSAEALFEPDEVLLPMSRVNNATYKLVNYGLDYHNI